MTRKCIICHKRKAEVPDRNRLGRPVKQICKVCHERRLLSDLRNILGESEWEK